MKAIFKFMAWLVAIVVVVVVAAVVLVPMFFNPNDFKPQIAAAVKDNTGRELSIEGDLEMSVFPWLGVSVGKASLGNAAGFSDPVFARSERMQVRVKLMPLLQRKLEMDTVTVHGLEVYLERDAKGGTNWADLARAGESGTGDPSKPRADAPGDTPQLASMALGGVEVVDAKLSWKDAQAGQTVLLEKVGLRTGALSLEDPVKVSTELDLNISRPAMAGHLELSTTVAHGNGGKQITATDLALTADLTGKTLPGGKLAAKFGADVAVDLQADTLRLGDLSLTLGDLQADGAIDVSALTGDPKLVGKLAVARFDLRKLLQILGQKAPQTADAAALTAVAFSADLSGSANSVSLKPLKVMLDDTNLTGALSVNNFAAPAVRFDLNVDGIDANRYLPPKTAGAAGTASGSGSAAGSGKTGAGPAVDLAPLRALDIDGNLAIGKLTINDVNASGVSLALKGKGGDIRLAANAELTGESVPGGKQAVKLGANLAVDPKADAVRIADLSLAVGDLKANGALAVSALASDPKLAGKLTLAPFNLRKVLELLGQTPPQTADPAALTAVAFNADFTGSANSVSLKPLKVTLDDTNVTGAVTVSDFASKAVRFDLKVDGIDADRYLPPPAGAQAAASSGGGAAAGGGGKAGAGEPLDLESLRALDIDGKLAVGKLKINNLKSSDIALALKAKGGDIRLSPVSAKLYEGSYAGNIGLDARGKIAKLSLEERLDGIKLKPLLTDLQGEAPIEGTAKVALKATATGTDAAAIKKSLNGNGSFEFTDGALNGINIAAVIREAKAKLTGGAADTAGTPQRTDFSALGGTFTITDGLVSNQDFAAKSPLLRIIGKGTANLVAEAIDYRTTVSVVATSKGQGGKDLTELAGLDVPLMIGGTFTKPTYGLDMEALIKGLASAKLGGVIEAQKEKVTAAVKEKVTAAVQDKVKGAVGDAVGGAVGGQVEKILGGSGLGSITGALGGAAGGASAPAAAAGATQGAAAAPAATDAGAAAPAPAPEQPKANDPAAAATKALKGLFN